MHLNWYSFNRILKFHENKKKFVLDVFNLAAPTLSWLSLTFVVIDPSTHSSMSSQESSLLSCLLLSPHLLLQAACFCGDVGDAFKFHLVQLKYSLVWFEVHLCWMTYSHSLEKMEMYLLVGILDGIHCGDWGCYWLLLDKYSEYCLVVCQRFCSTPMGDVKIHIEIYSVITIPFHLSFMTHLLVLTWKGVASSPSHPVYKAKCLYHFNM